MQEEKDFWDKLDAEKVAKWQKACKENLDKACEKDPLLAAMRRLYGAEIKGEM